MEFKYDVTYREGHCPQLKMKVLLGYNMKIVI